MRLTSKQTNLLATAVMGLLLAFIAWLSGYFNAVNKAVPAQTSNAQSQEIPVTGKESIVTKVIDGDTVIVSGGDHVRLLGIDADEKGYPCFDAARLRLEGLVLGKTVTLEKDQVDLDQYGRMLRYIFVGETNINRQLVFEGLAIARFYPENQKHKEEIVAAESQAIKNKTGCKWQRSENNPGN